MPSGDPMLSVLGELVVDLLPVPGADAGTEGTAPQFVARPGGNALNVAVGGRPPGHARCGCWPGWAPDRWRSNLRRHAELSGVDPGGFVPGRRAGQPRRRRAGARRLPRLRLPRPRGRRLAVDRRGARRRSCPRGRRSCTSGRSRAGQRPARDAIARLVERLSVDGSALISVDPNIRPTLADGAGRPDARQHRDRRARAAGPAGRPGGHRQGQRRGPGVAGARARRAAALDAAARRWAERGPALVILTDGGEPLRIARPGHSVLHRTIPRVTVADTVGAGDSLAAGLLGGLLAAGVTTPGSTRGSARRDLLRLVDDAALVAALNCTRVGADPPTRAELDGRPRGTDERRSPPGRLRGTERHRAAGATAGAADRFWADSASRRHRPRPAPSGLLPPVRRVRCARPDARGGGRRLSSSGWSAPTDWPLSMRSPSIRRGGAAASRAACWPGSPHSPQATVPERRRR